MSLVEPKSKFKDRVKELLRAVGGALSGHPRATLGTVAALALIAVAAASVVWLTRDSENDDDRLQEAREAAQASAVRLFSFSEGSLEKDLADARGVLTPELAENFEQDVAVPTREAIAANPGIDSRIIVAGSGVTSKPSDDDVSVLVLYNRIIRAPGTPQAQTVRLGALLTMREQGDDWLVSGVAQY